MGTDDIFKKRREERKKRKREIRTPKPNSFLIVAEGERTEPLYLQGLVNEIKEKCGGRIDIEMIPQVDIHGVGCSTNKLIEKTQEIVNRAKFIYQNIWVVFDKDDFTDFDDAIANAEKLGYQVAWSNQCFEYWIYLHFNYSDSALHRDGWFDKVNDLFQEFHIGEGEYRKNYEKIYEMLKADDRVKIAVGNAKRRMNNYKPSSGKPSFYDPGTTVHELVEVLLGYLE